MRRIQRTALARTCASDGRANERLIKSADRINCEHKRRQLWPSCAPFAFLSSSTCGLRLAQSNDTLVAPVYMLQYILKYTTNSASESIPNASSRRAVPIRAFSLAQRMSLWRAFYGARKFEHRTLIASRKFSRDAERLYAQHVRLDRATGC